MVHRFANRNEALELGERIAYARRQLNLTQGDLALCAHVERSLVSKVESGRVKTRNASVHALCIYLKIDASETSMRLATIQRRMVQASTHCPQVLDAVSRMLDAVEAAARSA